MKHLLEFARRIRTSIIDTSYQQQQGHVAGSLSIVDLLAVLYLDTLDIDPNNPNWPNRDRFVLSKGDASLAQYVTLALLGYFPYEKLQAHLDMTKLPGMDMSTGSRGQGFSAAVGIALGAKLQDQTFLTFTIIGDEETQAGQVWEAARVAERYNLDNLVAIIDNNSLQQYGWPDLENIGQPQPPGKDHASKWRAFGWNVIEIDGHNLPEIRMTFDRLRKKREGKPHMVIAHTLKGRGVPFMEGAHARDFNVLTDGEYTRAMDALKEGVEHE